MKLNFRLAMVVLAAAVLSYSACNKTGVKTTTTPSTVDLKSQGSQVVLSLYQSLTGAYGGVSINKPAANSLHKKSLNDITTLCGYTLDTAYTTVTKSGDTTITANNSYTFVYTCNGTKLSGNTLTDTLSSTIVAPSVNGTYDLGQHYTVLATDTTFKLFTLNGTSYLNAKDLLITPTSGANYSLAYVYTNCGLDFTPTVADITSGTVSFKGIQLSLGVTTPTSGTITFLGNYVAEVVFTGGTPATYYYNITTGAIVSKP